MLSTETVDGSPKAAWNEASAIWQVFTRREKGVECAPPKAPRNDSMKFLTVHPSAPHTLLSLRLAGWLLDNPRLGQAALVQRLAGQLLKQPARRGVVEAQSRLGLLLCRHCGSHRDRRIGQEFLRQAARAGDPRAQQALTGEQAASLS
jgi:TPR repeat protein